MSKADIHLASSSSLRNAGEHDAPPSPIAVWLHTLSSSTAFVGLLSLILFAGLWQFSVHLFDVKEYVLPSPYAIGLVIIEKFSYIAPHTMVTLKEVLLGFFIAVAIGIPVAVMMTFIPLAERLLYPLLIATQAVPKIAIAPLLLIWFGFGEAPKIAMATLIAVFPIIIDTSVGLRSIDPEMIRLTRSMRASWMKTFWKVRLPVALPNVFAGLKMAITFAVIGAVVGEFVAGSEGLGYLVQAAIGSMQTVFAFAGVVILSLMGIILFLIVEGLERVFVSWGGSADARH